ncbi:MAG: pyridoxal phosphate-dependent aminotransferase [Gammaproteobacteria bacterium]|nr:MAG: pyridoxal phosphate-dependent aminotransferase [Gammaproteobacteria bacterium]
MADAQPSLSRRARRLAAPDADVWRVHEAALERLAAGDDIILLSVGDPDFPTPEPIKQHTLAQLAADRTHYSPALGEPALRQAIADLETRTTGRPFEPEQFVIFPGATAALFTTFACIADSGAEVVVPEPMYIGYRGIFAALGISVVSVPLDATRNFRLDPDRVIDAINANTCAVVLNTPGNPGGNIIAVESLARIANACRQRGIWLVCDEVYSLFTFEEPHISLLRATDNLDNIVVIDGLSKSHAMSGWRIGWAVAPPDLVQALGDFSGSAFFGSCQFVQDGAAYALAHDEPFVQKMCDEYQARRDYLVQRIAGIDGLVCAPPQAGMFVMLDVSAITADGGRFAQALLDVARISTIPGVGFGATTRSYVRVSLTQPVGVLEEACDRINQSLPAIRSACV